MRTFWPSIIAMLSFFVITGSVMGFFIDTQPNFKSIVIDRSATEYDTGSSAIEIGDVDPNVPGNEILVTGYGWGIAEVYFLNDHWESKLIWNRSYQVWYDPALAVGDLDPDVEGNEIVEGLYELVVLTYDNTTGNWTNTTIWNPWGEIGSAILDVKIGDFDPMHTGNELLAISDLVYEFYKASNGTWVKINISGTWNHSTLHGCDIGNFDPRFDGNEIIVFTEENITEFAWNGSSWYNQTIDVSCFAALPGEVWSGCIGEINLTNDVEEIICGSGFRWITLVWWNGTDYEVEIIQYVDEIGSWVNSVAVGDCWTGHTGNEIVAGGGTAARTVLVWDENGTWQKQLIYENGSRYVVEDLEIGDFDPSHPGNEIAEGLFLTEIYEDYSVSEHSSVLTSLVFVAVPAVLFFGLRKIWSSIITARK